jgi:hypothetical protein
MIKINRTIMGIAQENQILLHKDLTEINKVKKNEHISGICFEQEIKHGEKNKSL